MPDLAAEPPPLPALQLSGVNDIRGGTSSDPLAGSGSLVLDAGHVVLADVASLAVLEERSLPEPAADHVSHGALDIPSLGINLSEIADWSTEQPFLDLMKGARPWVAHKPDIWGGWSNEILAAEGYLSPEGWPRTIPSDSSGFETAVLTGQPAAARSLAGSYVLRWEGNASISLNGLTENVQRDTRTIRFTYNPREDGTVLVGVTNLDPANPFRNMTLVREDRLSLLEAGAVFNPDFLARVSDFRALRFMDWMKTNGSTQIHWEDRPRVSDATWMQKGVPVEIMVQLANEIGADPWFTMPHQADDTYVAAFAHYVLDHLDPRLKVYEEWSNEVWNFVFPQTHWAAEQATQRWGVPPGGDAFLQYAGLRAAEVANIWRDIFGEETEDRLVRVIGVHTGWQGAEAAILEAPLAVAEGQAPPVESFDVYAVTGYFGHDIGSEEVAPQLHGWLAEGIADAEVTELARASLGSLIGEIWPYHSDVARRYGLPLVAYEGGTHIAGQGVVMDDERLTDFFTTYSFSPEMGDMYRDLLAGWRDTGGTLFMAYSDIGGASRYGSWGALRHLDDSNPRWDSLMSANASPAGWERRVPGTFLDGMLLMGSETEETLAGTSEEDDLLGLGGDDILDSQGGADRLHGGAGRDIARLPGVASDWTRTTEGEATLFTWGLTTVRLTAIEEVAFTGSGERLVLSPPN